MLQEVIEHPLPALVTKLEIPCYFIMGDYDYMTSSHAAKEFFDKLEAEQKEFIAFDQSAHYPQFEEKEKFLNGCPRHFFSLHSASTGIGQFTYIGNCNMGLHLALTRRIRGESLSLAEESLWFMKEGLSVVLALVEEQAHKILTLPMQQYKRLKV